ncbi:Acetylcholinesterase, partial [Bulinus truncatus]
PPEKISRWTSVLNTTLRSNSCWQTIDTAFNKAPKVDMWNANTNLSEDCLYLNAWIPNTPEVKPILVWIFGGGFWGGSSTLDVYDGSILARNRGVIVVSFNYRVGPFGFLFTGTADSPGNVGLLDQVMALGWIKDNAKIMGGNSDKITLFGESAGAVSVGYHMMSNLSRGLFNNAVMMSASPIAQWGIKTQEEALSKTHAFADLVSCDSQNLTNLVNCLRNVSPQILAAKQWNLTSTYFETPLAAVVDGYFLTKHPNDLLAEGQVKNTSVVIGVVKNEGSFWLAFGITQIFNVTNVTVTPSLYHTSVEKVLAPFGANYTRKYITDFVMREYYEAIPPWERSSYLDAVENLSGDTQFKCSVVSFAQQYAKMFPGQVYLYSYEHRESTMDWPDWFGVPHGYEIPFFFGAPFRNGSNHRLTEKNLSEDVMRRLVNFANESDPNYNGSPTTWPIYTLDTQRYFVWRENATTTNTGLRYRACDFWTNEVPMLIQIAENNNTSGTPSNKIDCVRSSGNTLYYVSRLLSCLVYLYVLLYI